MSASNFTMRDDVLAGGGAWRVRVYDESSPGRQLTWAEVLARLGADRAFALELSRKLSSAPFAAFFWEAPPLARGTKDAVPFECVMVAAKHLEGRAADEATFSRFIGGKRRGQGGAAVFPNLGGDTILVSPVAGAHAVAAGELGTYAHLAAFLRGAPDDELAAVWAALASALAEALERRGEQPTWVSTEGSGVSWLHFRLDSRPKYFHWAPYKRWPAYK